jgi:hypothetical protein
MTAERAWSVGEPRSTPKGRVLPGTNKETYCVFSVKVDSTDVSGGLDDVVGGLEIQRGVLLDLAQTGGRCEVFVSWEASSNVGDLFSYQFLERLIALKLSLAVEWFPQAGGDNG